MMTRRTLTFLLLGALSLSLWTCTKPELVGADLLDDEASQVGFTDTITLQCRHVAQDAVLTYTEETGRRVVRSLLGRLDDPFFGKTEASIYSEMFLVSASAAFLGNQIDSVVLTLRYDTLGLYGDLTQEILVGVHRIEEELDPEMDLRSDFAPTISAEPIALKLVKPQPYDSIWIQSRGDSARVPPMVRIPMTPQFINSLIAQDSSTFESPDSFRMWMKGLHVTMTQPGNTMLAFNLANTWSRMTVYYNTGTDTSETHFAFVDGLGSGIHHTRFVHDYSGSAVQQFLDDPALSDSLLFVQGMSGVNVEISLPGLPNLDNILINKAELEFYTADLPLDDRDLYPRVGQLINGVENEDGDVEISEDVSIVLRQFGLLAPFGGALTDIDTASMAIQKYTMNVTTSLQDIYKGRTENMFFVLPYITPNVPNRVILYGPAHPVYPARLRLTYTVVE